MHPEDLFEINECISPAENFIEDQKMKFSNSDLFKNDGSMASFFGSIFTYELPKTWPLITSLDSFPKLTTNFEKNFGGLSEKSANFISKKEDSPLKSKPKKVSPRKQIIGQKKIPVQKGKIPKCKLSETELQQKFQELEKNLFQDFDCSMEENIEFPSFDTQKTTPFSFVSKSKFSLIKESSSDPFILRKLVQKLEKRQVLGKIYTCEICDKKFDNHAALGGHKSKNHPKSSLADCLRKKLSR